MDVRARGAPVSFALVIQSSSPSPALPRVHPSERYIDPLSLSLPLYVCLSLSLGALLRQEWEGEGAKGKVTRDVCCRPPLIGLTGSCKTLIYNANRRERGEGKGVFTIGDGLISEGC